MFAWVKKHHKLSLLIGDGLLLPGMLLCQFLAKGLLTTNRVCGWTRWGGKCITCGGTHFVRDLCSFRILDAMQDNVFLFALTAYLFLSLIFLNLWLLFDICFFKKVLKLMYNIPTLIIWLVFMFIFLLARNLSVFVWIGQTLLQYL